MININPDFFKDPEDPVSREVYLQEAFLRLKEKLKTEKTVLFVKEGDEVKYLISTDNPSVIGITDATTKETLILSEEGQMLKYNPKTKQESRVRFSEIKSVLDHINTLKITSKEIKDQP